MENRVLPPIHMMTSRVAESAPQSSNPPPTSLPSIFRHAPRAAPPSQTFPKLEQSEPHYERPVYSNYHYGRADDAYEYTHKSAPHSSVTTPTGGLGGAATGGPLSKGYYSPPSSRRSSETDPNASYHSAHNSQHSATLYTHGPRGHSPSVGHTPQSNHPQPASVTPTPTEPQFTIAPTAPTNVGVSPITSTQPASAVYQADFSGHVKETQETASYLYYFASQGVQTMDLPQKLDSLHALIGRLHSANQFLESWYHQLYYEASLQRASVATQEAQVMHHDARADVNGAHSPPLKRESDGSIRRNSKKRLKPSSGELIRCHQCGASETPEWRRGPDGARTLCNACGLYHAKLVKKRGEAEAAEILRERRDSRVLTGDSSPGATN